MAASIDRSNLEAIKHQFRGLAGDLRNKRFGTTPLSSYHEFKVDIRRIIVRSRKLLSSDETRQLFDWIDETWRPQLKEMKTFPWGIGFLRGIFEPQSVSIEKELLWASLRLLAASERLAIHSTSRAGIEDAILANDLIEAAEILGTTETQVGPSYWQQKAAIWLIEETEGTASQKKYAAEFSRENPKSAASYLAFFISVRNEAETTWSWFEEDMGRRIDRATYPENLKPYMRYHLLGVLPDAPERLSGILANEQSSSDVDLFETFIAICSKLISNGEVAPLAAIQDELKALEKATEDGRLRRLNLRLEEQAADTEPSCSLHLLEKLVAGKRKAQSKNAVATADDLIVHGICRAFGEPGFSLPDADWLAELGENAKEFVLQSDRQGGWAKEIAKASTNLSFIDFGSGLGGFLPSAVKIIEGKTFRLPRQNSVSTGSDGFLGYVSGVVNTRELAEQELDSLQALKEVADSGVENEGLSKAWNALANVIFAARNLDWSSVSENAARLADCQPALKSIAIAIRLNSLVRAGDLNRAVQEIAKELVDKNIPSSLIPIDALVSTFKWSELRTVEDKMALAICYDEAANRIGDSEFATRRYGSLNQFLRQKGVDRLSEIEFSNDQPDRDIFFDFVSRVGTPDVIDMTHAMSSTREVQEERRNILAMLAKLDPPNADRYESEILEITNDLRLDEGLQVLDSSRIHVDIYALVDWASRELHDGFERFLALAEIAPPAEIAEEDLLAMAEGRPTAGKDVFSIPKNEADTLLLQLLQDLRKQFLFHSTHGLDSYLSRRIRHGSIVGFVRGPLEEAHLITVQDSKQGGYKTNDYWLDRLAIADDESRGRLDQAFAKFSSSFDHAVLQVRNEIVQIRSKEKPDGLISLAVSNLLFHVLRRQIGQDNSVEDFARKGIQFFFIVLEHSLGAIRNYLTEKLTAEASSAFTALREAVGEVFNSLRESGQCSAEMKHSFQELLQSIQNAQISVNAKIVGVSHWFKRPEAAKALHNYPLQEAVNIGLEAAKARVLRYNPDVELDIRSEILVEADFLSTLGDVMSIAIGNACERSGIDQGVHVRVMAEFSYDERTLTIVTENEVRASVRTKAADELLEEIRSDIDKGVYGERVRKDERSGLRKLASQVMAMENGEIGFGFEGNAFVLKVVMPVEFREVTKEAA